MRHDSPQQDQAPDSVNVLPSKHTPGPWIILTFCERGEFAATYAAERYLTERGFSFGRIQRGDPRGIMFGRFNIQKWRNLNYQERADLHGMMVGNGRRGPITITLNPIAPDEARAAIARATGADQC